MLELNLSHYQSGSWKTTWRTERYTLNHAELNIFETHQQAEKVMLRFSDPVL